MRLQAEVTARTTAESELRIADRRKDEFLATLAHELRNPLAPIRHALRIVASPLADRPKREWAHGVMERQIQRMARLLDDLLDVSRISRRTLQLSLEPVELNTLITTAVETVKPLIEEKRQTLTLSVPEHSITVRVDALRLSQALANLLSNSTKYTPAGGHIALSAVISGSTLKMCVSDDGRGFAQSELPAMFEMFTRVGGGGEVGLGIGLALVKEIVSLHGGTAQATSRGPGLRSEFCIELPDVVITAYRVPSRESTPAVPSPRSGKVLVVDDNRDSADTLAHLLKAEGYEVTVGYCGADALTLARVQQPDIAILDIGMPDLSGYEVARILRREFGMKMLLIAMTGWGQAKDKATAQAAGFNRHLTKPLDPEHIVSLLSTYLSA